MAMASSSKFDLKSYAADRRILIEAKLEECLTNGEPAALWESMRYSVLGGGKRLRALLCLAAFEAVKNSSDSSADPQANSSQSLASLQPALACACAIELIHAMSLIHDDLPALDNDDLRRGKPTNHKVFGEAMALLAGDALLMLAIEILIDMTANKVDQSVLLSVAFELTRATGAHGMVGGQVLDMQLTGTGQARNTEAEPASQPDVQMLEAMHRGKTGALIRFSVWSGARLAGASDELLLKLTRFGEVIGLAFQIADDLLDVTGDATTLGKTPGKDAAADKVTWVQLFGAEGSRQRLAELEREGNQILGGCTPSMIGAQALRALLHYAIHRSN